MSNSRPLYHLKRDERKGYQLLKYPLKVPSITPINDKFRREWNLLPVHQTIRIFIDPTRNPGANIETDIYILFRDQNTCAYFTHYSLDTGYSRYHTIDFHIVTKSLALLEKAIGIENEYRRTFDDAVWAQFGNRNLGKKEKGRYFFSE
jgi:hypothetical protein